MYDEMTIDDVANIVRVIGDERCDDPDRDVRALACAARRLLEQIDKLAFELERERARRHGLKRGDTRIPDGQPLLEGTDCGGRRDFLAGRPVHAGEPLFLLTCAGWHPVRYESNAAGKKPVLQVRLPGVREDVVIGVPRDACLAWPEEVRQGGLGRLAQPTGFSDSSGEVAMQTAKQEIKRSKSKKTSHV